MNNYPRPQMKRDNWQSLNGTWLLNGMPINVPYPPEAPASLFTGKITNGKLNYEKEFEYKKVKEKTLLHFGAVDQICDVYLNNILLGHHEGGYLPFTYDVSNEIKEGKNTLKVNCIDTLDHDYPYGKQTKSRGGMWYTPFSGIWKTVWLEQVPDGYIKDIKITPDLNGVTLDIDGEIERIEIENPVHWTVDNPYLYTHTITKGEDNVEIYFALRTIDIQKIDGINRVCLNNKPVFLHGILDQGYYIPGISAADSSEYEKDILTMKSLGFNMLRKHIKIESEEFYYLCDRLGMLVMQDMVNSGPYSFIHDTALPTIGFNFKDKTGIEGKRKEFFISHSEDTIKHLYNHPCVVSYTIFNEGWGQFESDYLYKLLKTKDPTRLFDAASGWFSSLDSDFDSEHVYFRTKTMHPKERPMLLSECGGYKLGIPGHLYTSASYGYGGCKSKEELTHKILDMYEKMVIPAISKGLAGCIYTQVSDVEDEINGLLTYDRQVLKVDQELMIALSKKLKIEN